MFREGSRTTNLETKREFAPYFACTSSHSTDRLVSWSCAKWGAANAPSPHRYGANLDLLITGSQWQAPFAGGAGAVCGGYRFETTLP